MPQTARAVAAQTVSETLRIAIGDGAVRSDSPGLNAVVVIVRVEPADGGERAARRLHVARFVGAARLKRGLAAVPRPFPSEPCVRNRQHRLLKRGVGPAPAAIGTALDT